VARRAVLQTRTPAVGEVYLYGVLTVS